MISGKTYKLLLLVWLALLLAGIVFFVRNNVGVETPAVLFSDTASVEDPAPDDRVQNVSWLTLEQTDFEKRYFPEVHDTLLFPLFGDSVLQLNGKRIQITGYIIPMTEAGTGHYVLSAYPYSNCFFCGGAGPESVMSLHLPPSETRQVLLVDQKLTFTGRFRLNDTRVDELNYNLDSAQVVYESKRETFTP